MGVLERIKAVFAGGEATPESSAQPPGGGAPGSEPNAAIAEALRAEIRARLDERLAGDPIDGDTHLFDAGLLDSMSSVQLLAFIEEHYGLVIEEVDLVGLYTSVDALAAHIAQQTGPA